MRVGKEVVNSAVFIGIKARERFTPIGTAVIAWVPRQAMGFHFLITARHLLDGREPGSLWVRLNTLDGGGSTIQLPTIQWYPAEASIDVVVVPLALGGTKYDLSTIPLDRADRNHTLATMDGLRPGDEVSVVGLYSTHYGLGRNLPIVRIGHIAALPSEPVLSSFGGQSLAYLIEVHSIAGLSGSPVFLNVPPVRVINNQLHHKTGEIYLVVGIHVGYHLVETKEDQILVPEFQGTERSVKLPVPFEERTSDERRTGLSVVIPIEVLFDLIESEEVQVFMRAEESALLPSISSTTNVASDLSVTIDIPPTRAD